MRRRAITAVAALVTALLAVTGLVAVGSPALAAGELTGLVYGAVQDPDGFGVGADDTIVSAYRYDSSTDNLMYEDEVSVSAGGPWQFAGLPIGDYAFYYDYSGSLPGIVDRFTDGEEYGAEVIAHGGLVSLDEGEVYSAGIFTHQYGSSVTVTLANEADAPIAGAEVTLYRESVWGDGSERRIEERVGNTAGDGTITFTAVNPGTYTTKYSATGYATEYYFVDPDDEFTLVAGGTFDTSAQLGVGGHIRGVIKGAGGVGLVGVDVSAYTYDADASGWYTEVATVQTGVGGSYDIASLSADTYRIEADPSGLGTTYLPRTYPAAVDLDHGTSVTLGVGQDLGGIGITLLKSSTITGKVTLGSSTVPGPGDVQVLVCQSDGPCGLDFSSYEGVVNPATGTYSVKGLRAGSYTLFVAYLGAGNYRDEYYNNEHDQWDATPIVVGVAATVTGKNVALDAGSAIAGTVVDASANPVADVVVGAFQVYGSGVDTERPVRVGTSDSLGHYSIRGLETGTYVVRTWVDGTPGFTGPWYGGTYNEDKATRVATVSPATVSGIDVALEGSATVQGIITASDTGDPLPDTQIRIYRFDKPGGSYAQQLPNLYPSTDEDGAYSVDLPPGQYAIYAEPDDDDYVGAAYGAAAPGRWTPTEGTRIDLGSGSNWEATFALQLGGSYTGRIVDGAGDPIPYAFIQIDGHNGGVSADGDGVFQIGGLWSGPHTGNVQGVSGAYVGRTNFSGPATTYDALPVDLGDLTVTIGSTITGVTRSTSGTALGNVAVIAWVQRAGGIEPVTYTMSAPNGTFQLDRLPATTVFLEFSTQSSKYPEQFLGGSPIWSLSDAVTLSTPGDTAHVEARLVTGGSIHGVVRNKVTGNVVPNIFVSATQRDPSTGYYEFFDGATTNSSGAYAISGLEAGGYDLTFETQDNAGNAKYTISSKKVTVPTRTSVTVNTSLVPTSKVSGVVKIGSAAVAGVHVVATRTDGLTYETTTSATGAYFLRLDAGSWTVFASDPAGRATAAFYSSASTAGTLSSLTATKIAVTGSGTAKTGKNIVLSVAGGSIDANISGDIETDVGGTIQLVRVDGSCSEVLSTQTFTPDPSDRPLTDLFPLQHVAAGDYCLLTDAESRLGDDGGPFAQTVTGPFSVTTGLTTQLGSIYVGSPLYVRHRPDPMVVAGSEPEISADLTPQVGETISVSTGTWTHLTEYYFFQWTRDGKPIRGAVGQTYQLTPGDAGATIAVQVGASDYPYGYTNLFLYTASLVPTIQEGDAAINVTLPTITGKKVVGQVLTAGPGTWDLPGLSFGYQWLRDDTPIAGATSKTYKLVAADAGSQVDLEVTASRVGFETSETGVDGEEILPAVAMAATTKPVASVLPTTDGWKVTTGTWSPSGTIASPISYTYLWREYLPSGDVQPFGSNASSVIDPGRFADTSRITVIVTASKTGYTPTSLEIPVRTGPKPTFVTYPTGDLTAPRVGVPIEVDAIDSSPPVIQAVPGGAVSIPTYQWYRGTTAITGATKPIYIPTMTDVGAILKVRIMLKATGYAAQGAADAKFIFSDPVAAPIPLTSNGDASVTGTAAVGRLLTANVGTWSATPNAYAYRWYRGASAITDATARTYKLTSADLGATVSVRITAKVGTVSQITQPSAGTIIALPLQNVTPPTIPVTARVGVKLTATVGTWDLTPSSYSYQWFRNDVPITAATSASYTPIVADLGDELTVRVTAKRSGYVSSEATASGPVTVQPGAAITATTAPALKVGGLSVSSVSLSQTVVSTSGSWPVASLSLDYQWQVSTDGGATWNSIADQTTTSLVVLDSGVSDDDKVRMLVTATRSGYLPSTATSAALTVTL